MIHLFIKLTILIKVWDDVVTSKILTEFDQKQYLGTDTSYITKIEARTMDVK